MKFPLEANAKQESLIRSFLEQTKDYAVILIGLDGLITHWLRGAEHLFGYEGAEVIGQPLSVLFPEEDRVSGVPAHELEVAIRSPGAHSDRWQLRRDGTQIWASTTTTAVRDEQGRALGFAKVVRDRTDLRAHIETLESRLKEREKGKAYKEVSLATLAHELRTPLGTLTNALYLIRLKSPPEALSHPLQIIERQIEALRRLVDDLGDAGRVATGQMRLNIEAVDLRLMLEELICSLKPEFEAQELSLHLLIPPGSIVVKIDRDRVRQAILNLLSNAKRYTPTSGEVWVKASVENQDAVIQVQDSGVGISTETLPHIFQLFARSPSSEQMAPGGMGIGLALVKEIVELHGGKVEVRSEGAGKGSIFSLRLPQGGPSSENL